MSALRLKHGQETRRPHGAALQPAIEHRHFARSRVQVLCQGQQGTTILARDAREHDGQPRHEERRAGIVPALRVEITRHTQLCEALFVVPIDARGKVTVRSGARRPCCSDDETRADRLGECAQGLKIACLPPSQPREGLLADPGPRRPLGVRQAEPAGASGKLGQR